MFSSIAETARLHTPLASGDVAGRLLEFLFADDALALVCVSGYWQGIPVSVCSVRRELLSLQSTLAEELTFLANLAEGRTHHAMVLEQGALGEPWDNNWFRLEFENNYAELWESRGFRD